ncbi:MAG: pitrilysin family protein [Pseudomonadota bacterium]
MNQKTTLKNNLRIVTENIPHVKSVSVGIWVNVGSRDETEAEGGISHFIEHMIFKGTARRDALQIAKEIDQVGGMSNAFTSKEFTCFHAKVMSDHLPLVTDLLTDIFLGSLFGEEDLERERQVILQEIRMVEDTPDELVHILFSRNLWPGHAVGRPVMGAVETVGSIGPAEIRDYLQRAYRPPKIVVAAAGDLEHRAFVDLIAPAFERLPEGEPFPRIAPPPTATGMRTVFKELEQVHLCLGAGFPNVLDDKRFAAAILNIILGGNMSSRLFQEIREKRGLAYSVYSFFSAYLDTGMLGVYAGVDSAQTAETVRLILVELKKFRDGLLDQVELKAATEHLKGSIILGSESVDNRMTRLAKNEITYGRNIDFDEVLDRINAVTLDEVVNLAEEYLRPENLNLTVLGPVNGDVIPPDALQH